MTCAISEFESDLTAAGLRSAPMISRKRARLPDLEPCATASTAPSLRERVVLTSASAQDEETDYRLRREASDPIARLTVYALNGCVLVFAFPLGFALLILNLLGGENLRTTAHALALTGMGLGLASLPAATPFL